MLRRRFLIAACSLMSLLLMVNSAHGWGRDGHEIVARIAEARLTPRAAAAVQELLGDQQTLADVASWADEVRKDREETSPWHYVDIPYEMRGYDPQRDGKNGNNVIDKIVEFANVLNDRNAPRDKRVEALKFLVHFMGDMHQPLHCAERNEDKGGNFRLVFFLDEPKAVNLHRVWDSVLLKHMMGKIDVREYSEVLKKRMTSEQQKLWSRGDPVAWANEAHALAVRFAYANLPVDGPPPKLDEAYVQAAEPIVEEQLSKAGVRLSNLLNRIFQ